MGFDRNRPVIQPNGSSKQKQPAGVHLTTCKICPEMIRTSESRVWARDIQPSRRIGLVHTACAATADCEVVGEVSTGGQHKYRT